MESQRSGMVIHVRESHHGLVVDQAKILGCLGRAVHGYEMLHGRAVVGSGLVICLEKILRP